MPLELTIKITVGRKDPDALVRLLIKQQQELLSAADKVKYLRTCPWSGYGRRGFDCTVRRASDAYAL